MSGVNLPHDYSAAKIILCPVAIRQTRDFYDGRLGISFVASCIHACFIGVACYNAVELIVLCFATFRRFSGCYFWSLLIASTCIIPFAVGYLLIIFELFHNFFSVTMEVIGWYGMVIGQSLVLWSRLHLVVYYRLVLRVALAMIITSAVVLGIPTSALEFCVNSSHSSQCVPVFAIYERIQLVGFSLQEIVLSAIYIWGASQLLQLRPRDQYRGTLIQLLVINFFLILMDGAVVGIQYAGYYTLHVTVKAMVYSIKLKLEYAILTKLVHMSQPAHHSSSTDVSEFVHHSHLTRNQDAPTTI